MNISRWALYGAWTLLVAVAFVSQAQAQAAAKRPNFVWILSEDNSVHYLRLYGHELGATPRIEALAKEGVVFDHAFSCSPVCSVARTTLMTGILAPRGGFQFHRRAELARLPDGLELWPHYLRQAGYYTSNNSKKDYNVEEGKGVWDESSRQATWRRRPNAATPFFHMETTTVSHESSLHFTAPTMRKEKTGTDPAAVDLHPYFPDTPTFRYTMARYYDRMKAVDEQVGRLVDRLREDGVLEDTFIFYFGDHGGVLPRGKGYLYETGLHVPLVVRVPGNWRHLVDRPVGSRAVGFVEFIDFGPTVLQLAGLTPPQGLDGRPFLGAGVEAARVDARDEAFGYADRFDEKYEMVRSLRKGRYTYHRNYQGFYPDGLQNNYRYKMLAYEEWRQLFLKGDLTAVQARFFQSKPAEGLYDLETDPFETRNLAKDPALAEVLGDLRERLRAKVKSLPDLGFYPESHLVDAALPEAAAFGRKHRADIARLVDVADLCLLPGAEAVGRLRPVLRSGNPWERQWAYTACAILGEAARSLVPEAREALRDENRLVRVRAAEFLGLLGEADPQPVFARVLAESPSWVEALITLNSVVFFRDHPTRPYPVDVKTIEVRSQGGEVKRRLEYLGVP